MYHIGCRRTCYDSDASDDKATRIVTLVFHREQLLYDIKNYAYIEGHVWGEETQHAQHTLVEIGEEGNVDRVNRILGVVHAAAVEMLYPYTKEEPIEDEVICDQMWTPADYKIKMNVPVTMSRTTLHLLNKLIHEFMVARVIYDWLSITHPEASKNWLDKALEAVEEINSIKNCRTGVLTRPSHPF
ncbi:MULTISPECIES: hypothetical protein [Muribaculaceae]|uniref:hypothetical protein n=1 Tax=Muribaculaceae TaxID=2005473 RepID=UPI002649910A|nr:MULTISPECIES: hypothetical protein [Muribaculaceae]